METDHIGINITKYTNNISSIKTPKYVGSSLHETNDVALYIEEYCGICKDNPTIEDVIIHETLHLVILKIEKSNPYDQNTAYWKLDKLCYPKTHDGLGFGLTLKKFRGNK